VLTPLEVDLSEGPEHHCWLFFPSVLARSSLYQRTLAYNYRLLNLNYTPSWGALPGFRYLLPFPLQLPTHHWVLCNI